MFLPILVPLRVKKTRVRLYGRQSSTCATCFNPQPTVVSEPKPFLTKQFLSPLTYKFPLEENEQEEVRCPTSASDGYSL